MVTFNQDIAHKTVQYCLANGKITKPNKCSNCDNTKRISAHHVDYLRPLFIQWLCPSCHAKWHIKNTAINQ